MNPPSRTRSNRHAGARILNRAPRWRRLWLRPVAWALVSTACAATLAPESDVKKPDASSDRDPGRAGISAGGSSDSRWPHAGVSRARTDSPSGAVQPASEPLASHAICRVQIQLATDALASLRRDPRGDVRGELRVDGARFDAVRLHLKGRTGSFRSMDDKPGFTLAFDDFATAGPHGARKIHLNNSVEDASFLREWISTEIFHRAGVPAPRVAHATVELNGRALGLYVLKEGFAEEFLARHFTRADGALFDIEPGHDVDQPLTIRLGRDRAKGQSALDALAAAATEPDLARRWHGISQVLDVDQFLRFIAVEVMIGHWDGYALGRNNFRIYHDPGSARLTFLPAGLDQVLTNPRLSWKPHPSGLLARAVLETSEGATRYEATFRSVFADHFATADLARGIDAKVAELGPFLGWRARMQLRREASALSAEIAHRAQNLALQLAAPEPPLLEPGPNGAIVTGWVSGEAPPKSRLRSIVTPEGREALHIRADGASSASWRAVARLARGRYRFEGWVRVAGVTPIPFGRHVGACLRRAGQGRNGAGLVGTSGWERLHAEFVVDDTAAPVELVCELRAAGGEAWFDRKSLRIVSAEVRGPGQPPPAGANIAEISPTR